MSRPAPSAATPTTPPAPVELHGGRLFALTNPIEIDERLAWYPPSVRGYTSVNAYLLVEGTQAVMVDSGVTVHRDALIQQLRACLPGESLSLAFTRIGEYHAISNATAIAEQLPVEAVYAMFPSALDWLEYRPRAERPDSGSWAIGHAPENRLATAEGVPVGPAGRRVHVMQNPVRLLPSQWFYDDGSRTLFSGNVFSHAWRSSPAGPWLVDDAAHGIEPEEVQQHLLARCWWMADAHGLDEIQRSLAEVFEMYDVQRIAPGFGCIIEGRQEVERHYELLQGAIGGFTRGVPA